MVSLPTLLADNTGGNLGSGQVNIYPKLAELHDTDLWLPTFTLKG